MYGGGGKTDRTDDRMAGQQSRKKGVTLASVSAWPGHGASATHCPPSHCPGGGSPPCREPPPHATTINPPPRETLDLSIEGAKHCPPAAPCAGAGSCGFQRYHLATKTRPLSHTMHHPSATLSWFCCPDADADDAETPSQLAVPFAACSRARRAYPSLCQGGLVWPVGTWGDLVVASTESLTPSMTAQTQCLPPWQTSRLVLRSVSRICTYTAQRQLYLRSKVKRHRCAARTRSLGTGVLSLLELELGIP